jgi:TalC/MipB family fructose-6-phosphate aldolase
MELWLDTIDYSAIKNASSLGILTGVTTNPSILSQAKDAPEQVLTHLLEIQPGYVAAQVTSNNLEGMLQQATRLFALSNRVIVKIPASEDGFKAIALLKQHGIPTLATTIFDAKQVILSSIAGAAYAAAYLGRLPGNQVSTLADMQAIVQMQNYAIKMMAAAVRSSAQFVDCARLGVSAITLPINVYEELFMPSSYVTESLQKFALDWLANPQTEQSDLFAG